MSAPPTVVYDACVLYPAPLRSLLMYIALAGLCRARWTDTIHEEWIRSVLKNRPDLHRQQLLRVRDLMNRHAPDALVEGYEPHISTLTLPDPEDRHVLACALQSEAEFIVTFNGKDFPAQALQPHHVRAVHPDDFLLDLLQRYTDAVLDAARVHRAGLKNLPMDGEAYLGCLLRQRLPQTVARLRLHASAI